MAKNANNNQPVDRTELIWPGKRKEVERVELPFQTIETINLPRGQRQEGLFETEDGWKNRLIWGDNLLIMGSLLKELAGKINLIYIDPPFATGDDFSFEAQIGDTEITKEPSALELKAYRDTWGKGMQSYLQMMYDRLVLMKELLADDGSIYVHCDWRLDSYIRTILDELFGLDQFVNEIVWQGAIGDTSDKNKKFIKSHDTVFFYRKNATNILWNDCFQEYGENALKIYKFQDEKGRYQLGPCDNPGGGGYIYSLGFGEKPPSLGYRMPKETALKWLEEGILVVEKGKVPLRKWYMNERGVRCRDVWIDIGKERGLVYATQKPEKLLERIIKASSNEGDLVADFFAGSGTTGVVAEKLGRKWIMSDLGRFAIHTARKRLLDISAKPFVVQNLGKYERHRWVKLNGLYKNYIKFILELYHAEPTEGFTNLHGRKDKAFVRIGAVDAPVTLSEIRETLSECKENNIKRLDVLGWEWEMGLHDLVKEEAERYGVKLGTFQIPREVMELNVSDQKIKDDIHFYELAYLEVEPKIEGKRVTITLKDFIIPNPELLPEGVKGISWSDFIDYWAVDWMFNQHEEETEEDDTFHNMNQEYRTRKNPKLNLSMSYDRYPKAGKYTILVKVIDIFGNDTTKLLEVKI